MYIIQDLFILLLPIGFAGKPPLQAKKKLKGLKSAIISTII